MKNQGGDLEGDTDMVIMRGNKILIGRTTNFLCGVMVFTARYCNQASIHHRLLCDTW